VVLWEWNLSDEDVTDDGDSVIERLTVPSLAAPPGYAHVAVATGARLVVTAGAVPLDASGMLVGAGDVRRQARQTLNNLMAQLAAAGASGDDVMKTTVYVASTDRDDLVAVWEVVQRSPLAAAASTLLGVALLGYADQLVEIEAIAALP
jgi:enamine deaminase RidA (YjgF/YER057c/UK114 family)